jgi:hypothetical protein
MREAGQVLVDGLCDDLVMKYSTAMSRLTDVVDGLDRAAQWPDTTVTAACVFGTALDANADLDRIDVALVVVEAPEVVPWMSRPAHLEALAAVLRFPSCPCCGRGGRKHGRFGTMRSIARFGSGPRPADATNESSMRSPSAGSTP